MMSQLGRIGFVDHRDPLFQAFLDDLGNQVEVQGLRWLGAQGIGNIMHAVGKMNLRNHRTSMILFSQVDNHGDWLVNEGTLQAIANTVWACVTLGCGIGPNSVYNRLWVALVDKPKHVSPLAKRPSAMHLAILALTLPLGCPNHRENA
eukprot:scaffold22653_cov53-Attheya_sp.AAC.3